MAGKVRDCGQAVVLGPTYCRVSVEEPTQACFVLDPPKGRRLHPQCAGHADRKGARIGVAGGRRGGRGGSGHQRQHCGR